MDSSREIEHAARWDSAAERRGRTDRQGQQRRRSPRKSAAGPALHHQGTLAPLPPALAYVSLPAHTSPAAAGALLIEVGQELAAFASREGFALAGTFSDIRGRSESGIYRLIGAIRRNRISTVVVPDPSHLRHSGCLAGADIHAAARHIKARILIAAPGHRGPLCGIYSEEPHLPWIGLLCVNRKRCSDLTGGR